MNLTPAPACDSCGRDGGRDAPAGLNCGGNLVDVRHWPYFVAMGVTATPMVVAPVILAWGLFSSNDDTGWEGIVAMILLVVIGTGMSVYAGIGAAIGYFGLLRMLKNRSLGLGVLYGLGGGAALGILTYIVYVKLFAIGV